MGILDPMELTVSRTPGGWGTDGRWTVTGPPIVSTFIGSRPQPVGPAVMQRDDEGAREIAQYVTYVEADQPEILTVEPGYINTLSWRGDTYQLLSAEDWDDGVPLAHRAYVLVEVAIDEQ